MPIIVALLGKVASIELAELQTHPNRVLHALGDSPGTFIDFECAIVQKTLELPGAPGGGINLAYSKLGSTSIDARLARQVVLPEGTFFYEQNIIRDGRKPDTLYCWPRAFILFGDMPMGETYGNPRPRMGELPSRPRPYEIHKSAFEERLRQAGSVLIGPIEAADVGRLVSEPLSEQYQLHP